MFVINKEIYGFLIQPQNYETVNDAISIFYQFKIDALGMYHKYVQCITVLVCLLRMRGNFEGLIFHGRQV